MPTQTSLPENDTSAAQVTGNIKAQDYPIYKGDKDGIFALSILAIILFSFLAMIFKDLLGKKSKKNQRAVKKKDGNGVELLERVDSGPCIERLGGGWPPKRPLGSQANDEKSASGKATQPSRLPHVTEVSVDPDHVDPQSRTLPSMSGLPVVFEVPEINSGFDKDDDGFTHTPVREAGSNASRHGSVEYDNALGVYNHGESSIQNALSSSTSHHHSAGSSSNSSGHHYVSASSHHSHHHSYSNSHGHDSWSHTAEHGHTDSGGFDGGGGCYGDGD
ncbi:hypothetical protein FBEOM_8154 [Fusarium beomiforme]|uniref:Uncharacterized protein n=1 Tax=Fusarium beomiforme TaxID=44412 RepID=A0A9P5DUJ1_9HYPO|nr:hypothetical protein FBEOM_8154 [Fusarium beomiforme]